MFPPPNILTNIMQMYTKMHDFVCKNILISPVVILPDPDDGDDPSPPVLVTPSTGG